MVNQWRQATLNGGGFITGLLQDPQHPNVLYARSYVAGVFKSTDHGCLDGQPKPLGKQVVLT